MAAVATRQARQGEVSHLARCSEPYRVGVVLGVVLTDLRRHGNLDDDLGVIRRISYIEVLVIYSRCDSNALTTRVSDNL